MQDFNTYYLGSPLVDAHVHLQDLASAGLLDKELVCAAKAGVRMWACNGTSEEDWITVLDLSQKHRSILPFIGVHPWYVSNKSACWQEILEKHLSTSRCGVGEVGLDAVYAGVGLREQEEVFCDQLQLARSYKRPISIHCVRAWSLVSRILRSNSADLGPIQFHAFSGSLEVARELLKCDVYFSFSSDILHPRRIKLLETVKSLPIDRVLIETDYSKKALEQGDARKGYCNDETDGQQMKGQLARLYSLFMELSKLLDCAPELLAERLWQNSQMMFGGLIVKSDG